MILITERDCLARAGRNLYAAPEIEREIKMYVVKIGWAAEQAAPEHRVWAKTRAPEFGDGVLKVEESHHSHRQTV